MKKYSILFLSILTGCSTIPRHDVKLSRLDVIKNIYCQVQQAIIDNENVDFIKKGRVLATLTLQETQENLTSVGPNIQSPLSPGVVTFTANGSANGRAIRTAATEFFIDVDDVAVSNCDASLLTNDPTSKPILKGNLQLSEEIRRLVDTHKFVKTENFESHNYTFAFRIIKTAELNPVFTMIPVANLLFGSPITVRRTDTDDHTVQLTFTPQSDTPATKVIIVDDETVKTTTTRVTTSGVDTKGLLSTGSTTIRQTTRSKGNDDDSKSSKAASDRRALNAQSRENLRAIQRDVSDLE